MGAMRSDLTTQRCVRRITLTPKYGSAPCAVDVSYLWCGAPDAPTVIVQGGISANRDVVTLDNESPAGWWQDQVGAGRPLDLDRYRVLSIDWLTPADLGGAQAISSEDQADALAALVEALGIGRVHAFIGASYGAMAGLAFAARHPYALGRLVLLAGAHRPHPLATAQRSVQRGIVRLGLD
ncbi:alpha/beta fold hydrolase, partial [Dyella sp. ASV21]|uniref:alpha/beta fold hydrolase n=1 Tax=Dyella sp. ASV21 TaxID=2795114 RepID=UPI001E45716C